MIVKSDVPAVYRLFVKTHRLWEAAGGADTEYIFSTYADASTAQELLIEMSLDTSSETLYESFIDEVVQPLNTFPIENRIPNRKRGTVVNGIATLDAAIEQAQEDAYQDNEARRIGLI